MAGHHGTGEGHDRMELALRASNEGIWDWWVGQPRVFYSRRILEFLECSGSAAPNLFLPPHEQVHEEDRGLLSAALQEAFLTSGPELLAVDCRVRTGGGEWRWLRIRGAVVRDREGTAVRLAGSMIDISRRKEAENALEEERHLLRQVIDNVPLQVYFKDSESRFVLANRRMAEWMGFRDPRELAGKHDRDFFGQEHWAQAAEDERRIMENGEPLLGQLERETWQGEDGDKETWVLTSKFPWLDRHGKVKGTFGVSSDVTALVKAQQQSATLAAELAERNRTYEEELQLAREIQQALASGRFPDFSNDEGITLAFGSRYLPISGLAGDFFEVIPVSRTRAGLLVCDVMGHGVRSALVVAMMRGLVEKERRHAGDPALFLRGLNAGLHGILERAGVTMFATAFYLLVDLESRELTFASAGHPGAVVNDDEGERQLLCGPGGRGPGLGLFHKAEYENSRLALGGIRRMVLFTDGVLEASNPAGEAFLEGRLLKTLGEARTMPLEETLDHVLSRVLAFCESHKFDDDVCVLGVEVRRPGDFC